MQQGRKREREADNERDRTLFSRRTAGESKLEGFPACAATPSRTSGRRRCPSWLDIWWWTRPADRSEPRRKFPCEMPASSPLPRPFPPNFQVVPFPNPVDLISLPSHAPHAPGVHASARTRRCRVPSRPTKELGGNRPAAGGLRRPRVAIVPAAIGTGAGARPDQKRAGTTTHRTTCAAGAIQCSH